MTEDNISQEFRLKNINEIRIYFIEEINQNEWMRKNHKRVGRVLNYIENLLILISIVTGFVSISAFDSVVGILEGIMISAVGLKICVITAVIKKSGSIIEKNKKKDGKILLLVKSKLNIISP